MKILALVLGLMLMASTAFALNISEGLSKLPASKQGVGYSFNNDTLQHTLTWDVLKKDKFILAAGIASQEERIEDLREIKTAVVTLGYDIGGLKALGIDVPILDLIEITPFIYGGVSRIELDKSNSEGNNEGTWGVGVTFIAYKF